MTTLAHSITALREAFESPRDHRWAWTLRHRIAEVRRTLMEEPGRRGDAGQPTDGWLVARNVHVLRQRGRLRHRLSELSSSVGAIGEQPALAVGDRVGSSSLDAAFHRLLADLEHHRQRLNDLAYDEVELELGGSE